MAPPGNRTYKRLRERYRAGRDSMLAAVNRLDLPPRPVPLGHFDPDGYRYTPGSTMSMLYAPAATRPQLEEQFIRDLRDAGERKRKREQKERRDERLRRKASQAWREGYQPLREPPAAMPDRDALSRQGLRRHPATEQRELNFGRPDDLNVTEQARETRAAANPSVPPNPRPGTWYDEDGNELISDPNSPGYDMNGRPLSQGLPRSLTRPYRPRFPAEPIPDYPKAHGTRTPGDLEDNSTGPSLGQVVRQAEHRASQVRVSGSESRSAAVPHVGALQQPEGGSSSDGFNVPGAYSQQRPAHVNSEQGADANFERNGVGQGDSIADPNKRPQLGENQQDEPGRQDKETQHNLDDFPCGETLREQMSRKQCGDKPMAALHHHIPECRSRVGSTHTRRNHSWRVSTCLALAPRLC